MAKNGKSAANLKTALETIRRNPRKSSILPKKLEAARKGGENRAYRREMSRIVDSGVEELFDSATHWALRERLSTDMKPKEVKTAVAAWTSSPSLNITTGGIASGVTEIYGEESVGKTALLGDIVARAQDADMGVAYVSSEYFDQPYLGAMGVDVSKLVLIRSPCWEDAYEPLMNFLGAGDHLLLAIDSGTAMRPRNEESNWAERVLEFIHLAQRVMGRSSCVVMTNQVRARRSVEPHKFFAGGTDSTARRIAGCFSLRLELSRDTSTDTSFDMVAHIVSNVLRPPMTHVTLPVTKGRGIRSELDVVDAGLKLGYITKSGSWYSLKKGELSVQGKEEMARLFSGTLREDAETIRQAACEYALR